MGEKTSSELPRRQVVQDAERLVITKISDFRTAPRYSPHLSVEASIPLGIFEQRACSLDVAICIPTSGGADIVEEYECVLGCQLLIGVVNGLPPSVRKPRRLRRGGCHRSVIPFTVEFQADTLLQGQVDVAVGMHTDRKIYHLPSNGATCDSPGVSGTHTRWLSPIEQETEPGRTSVARQSVPVGPQHQRWCTALHARRWAPATGLHVPRQERTPSSSGGTVDTCSSHTVASRRFADRSLLRQHSARGCPASVCTQQTPDGL